METLVARAAAMGYRHLALTDRAGVYASVKFCRAAREAGIHPVVGAEFPDSDDSRVTVLVRNSDGYSELCRQLTRYHLESGTDPLPALEALAVHNWVLVPCPRRLETILQRFHSPHLVAELVDYGRYGMQIAPFVEHYGSGAVLLTSLEGIKADPGGEIARIGAFLGREVAWRDDLGVQNVSAARLRKLPFHGLLVDNPVATALRRRLVPKWLRTKIHDARTVGSARPELPASLVADLVAAFAEDRERLAGYFPGHPALTACYPFLP